MGAGHPRHGGSGSRLGDSPNRQVPERQRYLFSQRGFVYNRNSAGKAWRDVRSQVGMDGFTLHDLRHFYASGLIAAGCDVVTVQNALGHATPSITLDTYSHLWPKPEERTRNAAAGLMSAVFADDSASSADSVRTGDTN